MASLTKDERSPYWTCCYTSAGGRRLKKSTKQTDRTKALEVCLRIERAEKVARDGAMTERTAREILGEILERTTGDVLGNHKAGEWLTQWAEAKAVSKETSTGARYQQVVRDFKQSLGARARLSLAAITPKDITTYRAGELAANKSNRTANTAVRCLSAAFNAAQRVGIIPANPCNAIDSLEENPAGREPFTAAQVVALLKAADDEWGRAIAFGYYTGARLGDVAAMRWSMIDLQAGVIRFTPKKTKRKVRQVVIPIHPELERALLAAPGVGSAPVFPALNGRPTGGKTGLSWRFRKIMTRAGIVPKETQHRPGKKGSRKNTNLSFHSLRHTFSSALANAEVLDELRMKLTGHTKRETHAGYTHHEVATLRKAVEKIPRPA